MLSSPPPAPHSTGLCFPSRPSLIQEDAFGLRGQGDERRKVMLPLHLKSVGVRVALKLRVEVEGGGHDDVLIMGL